MEELGQDVAYTGQRIRNKGTGTAFINDENEIQDETRDRQSFERIWSDNVLTVPEERVITKRCSKNVCTSRLEEQTGRIDLTDVSLVSGEGREQNGYIRRSIDLSRGGPIEHARRGINVEVDSCLLYTSPSPRDQRGSRMPSSA